MSDSMHETTANNAALAAEVRRLRGELRAMQQRAEAAEATGYDVAAQAAVSTQNLREALAAMQQRAEAAEAALDSVGEYADYYHDAITDYECGGPRQPLDFAEWLAQQSEVQP